MESIKRAAVSERSFLIVCILLGAVQAWICRYLMISDGVSYLDIGDAYLRGDWAAAVNAYWSPMYSWWLGVSLYLLKPSLWWEYPTVHLVNLIIYVVALFSFRFFIHSVLGALKQDRADDSQPLPLPEYAFLGLAYSLFLLCSIQLIDVGRVTPDLLVAAVFFLIAGLMVDLRIHDSYWKFAVFGALNGVAYLCKGIMFPLGFGFLVILLFSGKLSRSRVCGVLLSAAMFLAVCTPFIFVISKAKGRLTFGETGKLAYAVFVNPSIPQIHWQGDPPGSGTPRHPTRKLLENPQIFEFGEPIRGTYPPWDDPSYWDDGVRWIFSFRQQLRVLVQSAFVYEKLLLAESGLLAGAFIFILIGGEQTRRAIASNWPLLAAAGLTLAAYSLVLVVTRYIGASMVLLWVSIFAGVRLPKNERLQLPSKYVVAAVAATVLLSVAGHMVDTAYTTLTVGSQPSAKDDVTAAAGLQSMGLRAGDKVATIGEGIINHWARLGRFRIVAEAPSPTRFWASSSDQRNSAYECLTRAGARAVIAWDPLPSSLDSRWKQVSNTNYYVYFF
jgi:hypothetical protein